MILTRERCGETISVGRGEEILLSLPENPTTGYRWRIAAEGIDVVGDDYVGQAKPSVGGGGERTWRLVSSRAGDAVVTASLQRSWEDPAKAVDRCELRFTVS